MVSFPRRGRRASLFLLLVSLAATLLAAPGARAQNLVVHDATGDAALAGGDLRSVGAVVQDGRLLLSATPLGVTPSPYAVGPWADPATEITWTLADADGADLYTVTYHMVQVGNSTGVTADVVRLADDARPCRLATASTYWGAYAATVPLSCVPGFRRFRAEMTYKDGAVLSHDVVPDHGDSDVVMESGPAFAPGLVIPADVRAGYWALAEDGAVYNFGDVRHLGDATRLMMPFTKAVDIDASPRGMGYWILTDEGRAFNCYGACVWSPPWIDNTPVVVPAGFGRATSLSVTPSGAGVWIFGDRGQVAAFGDARSYGDLSGVKLNAPIVDSVATPSGRGYYMVAADGGVFSFGDARFVGSMGATHLNAPVRALVPDGDGSGYSLVAADGGIFAFDAPFKGSMGGTKLNRPVRGMIRYGDGYLMVAEDGGIFTFSSEAFAGSLGASPPASPVVSVVALNF